MAAESKSERSLKEEMTAGDWYEWDQYLEMLRRVGGPVGYQVPPRAANRPCSLESPPCPNYCQRSKPRASGKSTCSPYARGKNLQATLRNVASAMSGPDANVLDDLKQPSFSKNTQVDMKQKRTSLRGYREPKFLSDLGTLMEQYIKDPSLFEPNGGLVQYLPKVKEHLEFLFFQDPREFLPGGRWERFTDDLPLQKQQILENLQVYVNNPRQMSPEWCVNLFRSIGGRQSPIYPELLALYDQH